MINLRPRTLLLLFVTSLFVAGCSDSGSGEIEQISADQAIERIADGEFAYYDMTFFDGRYAIHFLNENKQSIAVVATEDEAVKDKISQAIHEHGLKQP